MDKRSSEQRFRKSDAITVIVFKKTGAIAMEAGRPLGR